MVAGGDGILPELDLRLVVVGMVVEEEEGGDGAALVGRPLVQAPRHLLHLHIHLPGMLSFTFKLFSHFILSFKQYIPERI